MPSCDDRGYVTAEAACVVPALVLLVAMLLWGPAALAAQLQCGDAARAGARAVARGEPADTVLAVARTSAPAGAEVRVSRDGSLHRVEVAARAPGPGPLRVRVAAGAVAHAEPQ
ncbi:TadE family type IV pilus minor pilin [Streptomyces sp. ACA25]|uniref:TadE family type IV pilus minor pilin n=1 Tax=Streptomyces sp. ACA25 TaxID=3022596 RepID=UPI002307010F|nr:TadE family type IV pilus minor pilin [Streptomyces sp. ACA25]MDB1086526.1 TadE family type IV pilus minor pilin [Streptomyces sp. ACA25]